MSKKYGVREICNVVWRALGTYTIGGKTFYKGEPVLYFDSLKTTTLEGAATTVYAQGGRGNARLISWDGEKTLTLTMEDALISLESFQLLAGAQANKDTTHYTHELIRLGKGDEADDTHFTISNGTITFKDLGDVKEENGKDLIYVIKADEDGFNSEPYLYIYDKTEKTAAPATTDVYNDKAGTGTYSGTIEDTVEAIYVDYYKKDTNAKVIRVEPDSFGYNFYIEGETLFRDTDGIDYPAVFTLPKARVQNNFSISMASSGDPSTFSFVLDAFPGYTRCNNTTKCLCEIVISETASGSTGTEARVSTSAPTE